MKGTITDLLFMMPVIFVIGVALLIGGSVANDISNSFANDSQVQALSTADKNITTMISRGNDFYNGFSNFFPFIVVGLGVIIFFLAKQSQNDSIFMGISLLVLTLGFFFAVPLANAFHDISTSPYLSSKATQYTPVTFIFENFVLIILGFGALVLIALYSNRTGGSSGL